MKNKEVILITLLIVAIVLSTIFIFVNVHFMNEIKPYITSGPTGNVVFEIFSDEEITNTEGGINEIG